MKLHRAGAEPDWAATSPATYNSWQKLAAKTGGIATPGNVISLIGFCLVICGLWIVATGNLWQGTAIVTVGRILDIADGIVADHTQTKSPLGEAVDASLDKVSSLAALSIFAALGILPFWIAALIMLQNTTNVLLSLLAKWRHIMLHPTREGKLATAGFWTAIVVFVMVRLLANHHITQPQPVVATAAYVLCIVSLLLGIRATAEYIMAVCKPS